MLAADLVNGAAGHSAVFAQHGCALERCVEALRGAKEIGWFIINSSIYSIIDSVVMPNAAEQLGEQVQALLRNGQKPARFLLNALGVSQPTLSRAIRALGDRVLPIGAARSIQYTLRDPAREHLATPVFRVSAEGQVRALGTLVPVCPEGFVMLQCDGTRLHTEGLPWWLYDMRPQGYLGRAYANQFGEQLELPPRLDDWGDSHVLRALLGRGQDLPGNILVGDRALEAFLNVPELVAVPLATKAQAYAELAAAAARGEHYGSSAGGEQPKFTAYAELAEGTAHVIVKFSAASDNPVSQRWRDLLQAESLALQVLSDHGIPAAQTCVINHDSQRFLEVVRFDRVGTMGRRALFSLAAVEAEFVGSTARWPTVVRELAAVKVVQQDAVAMTDVIWAYGTLIGNTDMHNGNLSFMAEHGRPYQLAPVYDMTPMAFAPNTGGDLPVRQLNPTISPEVPAEAWLRALPLAQEFVRRLRGCGTLSEDFSGPLEMLRAHVEVAEQRISRLAPS